jgi:hypothetical protein
VDATHPVPKLISHCIDYLSTQGKKRREEGREGQERRGERDRRGGREINKYLGLEVPNLFRGTADKKHIIELREAFEKGLLFLFIFYFLFFNF